jgi:hypothetical protein
MAKKTKILNVYKLGVKADVVQADGIQGFACYLSPSMKDRRCIIGLNVEAFMGCVATGQIKQKDLPYILAESIMHEVIHALEEWAKVKFSHRKVNKLIKAYSEHYYGKNGVETLKRKKQ